MVNLLVKIYAEPKYYLLMFLLVFPLEDGIIAIEVRVVDFLLTLPLAVSIVGIEVCVIDLLRVLPLAVSMVGAEIRMMPFLLTFPMELGMVALVKCLAGTCIMTNPNLVVVVLFVGKAGEFL